jgi:hypothetical protein
MTLPVADFENVKGMAPEAAVSCVLLAAAAE